MADKTQSTLNKSTKNKKEIKNNIIPIKKIRKMIQFSLDLDDGDVTKVSAGVPEMIAAATAEFIKYLAISGNKYSYSEKVSYDAIVPIVQEPKFIFLREVFPIKMPMLTRRRLNAEETESESSSSSSSVVEEEIMEGTFGETDDNEKVVPIKMVELARRFIHGRFISDETENEASNAKQVEKRR